jgi:hypothetical protein
MRKVAHLPPVTGVESGFTVFRCDPCKTVERIDWTAMNDATRFRQQAQEARDRSGTPTHPDAARQWVGIAEEFDQLAVMVAARERPKQSV